MGMNVVDVAVCLFVRTVISVKTYWEKIVPFADRNSNPGHTRCSVSTASMHGLRFGGVGEARDARRRRN